MNVVVGKVDFVQPVEMTTVLQVEIKSSGQTEASRSLNIKTAKTELSLELDINQGEQYVKY